MRDIPQIDEASFGVGAAKKTHQTERSHAPLFAMMAIAASIGDSLE